MFLPAPSLRQRLLLAITLPLTVIFAVAVFFDYRLARQTADAAFDQSLADAVLDIAAHLRKEEGPGIELSSEAESMLRSDGDGADQVFFAVWDEGGRLLVGDTDLPLPRLAPGAGNNQPAFEERVYRDRPVRSASLSVPRGGGLATISVAETLGKRNRASRHIMTAMVLPNVLMILATLLAVYFGIRRGLAPLDRVENDIASRSPHDLRPLDLGAAPREIQPLLARLNTLFGLLSDAAAAQQRFLADAAHQLRTPLAGLQTQIELADGEGRFADDPERRQRIDEATQRLTHLVSQLLTVARAEPTASASQVFAPVALHELVEQAASLFIDQAIAKRIDLGFEIAPATVDGVPWMLREALANLIDNALHYTPAGGVVTVRSSLADGLPRLEVDDSGPGIPAAERDKVFQRFYRMAGSPGAGCGLGLAIVGEIASLHEARVHLGDSPLGGLRISLDFPPPPG